MAVNSFNAQNPPVTTKGDLFTFSTIPTRLGVGANNTVLTADSTTATGLKWASPSAAATSWTLINSGGTALTGAQTITVSSISGYDKFFIYFTGASSASAQSEFRIRFNGDTANNYQEFGLALNHLATYSTSLIDFENDTGRSSFRMVQMTTSATNITSGYLLVTGGNTSGIKQLNGVGAAQQGGSGAKSYAVGGFWNNSATISSISINSEFGNFDAGTLYIYGAQ